jgi:hypothetical protein
VSYAKSTPANTILKDLTSQMGFPVAGVLPNLPGSYSGGWTFVGKTQKALEMLLNRFGYAYCIQNEQLYIFQDGNLPTVQQMVLNYNSGLLSFKKIEQRVNYTKKGAAKKTAKTKYKLESLFFPQLLPGARIMIESQDYSGAGKITATSATLSNYEDDWTIDADVEVG